MGAYEDYQDAEARGDYHKAFELALMILNRKGSKRLMADWIDACVNLLTNMGKANLLPEYFDRLSVYGQRDELAKIDLNK